MTAALRLEDFAPPKPARAMFTADEMRRQCQRAAEDAARAAREADLLALTEALRDAALQAQDRATLRQRTIDETLQAVTPVLCAIVSQLSTGMEDRICALVGAELQRLCHAGLTPACRVAGPPQLIDRLTDHVAGLGLSGIELVPGETTEISFEGGRISVDPQEISARLTGLLDEFVPAKEA